MHEAGESTRLDALWMTAAAATAVAVTPPAVRTLPSPSTTATPSTGAQTNDVELPTRGLCNQWL